MTRATGTSSSSATIWAKPVSTPMPISDLPVKTCTFPSRSMRSQASKRLGEVAAAAWGAARRQDLRQNRAIGQAEANQEPAGILDEFSSGETVLGGHGYTLLFI